MPPFSSESATLKHQLIRNVKEMRPAIERTHKQNYARYKSFDNEIVKGGMADLARAIQCQDALPSAVVVDFTSVEELIFDNTEVVLAMYEDVCQWEKVEFPFESMLLRLSAEQAIFVYVITADDLKDKTRYYNVVYCVSDDRHGWLTTRDAFQIRANSAENVSLDDSYYAADKATQERTMETVQIVYPVLCAFLFLLRHKKLVTPDVKVPQSRNTKRIKRGKAPYSEYKVATLGDYTKKGPKLTTGEEPGTHASPKMHIRCGHWRRKPFLEEKIWIRSTVVGDPSKGCVIKEYKL
jgi:hypothetical protein